MTNCRQVLAYGFFHLPATGIPAAVFPSSFVSFALFSLPCNLVVVVIVSPGVVRKNTGFYRPFFVIVPADASPLCRR